MAGSNVQNKNNSKSLLQKKRTNKKKRRTAVSSSESSSSSSSSSSSDSSDNDEEEMAIEIEEDNEIEAAAPQLLSSEQKPKKSTLIRDDIQISDSEIKKSILQNQLLLDSMPISEFLNLKQINTVPELKQVENDITKKADKLKNNKPVIDNAMKNKFLTEVFKNYSDDINSLRESNDFNSKHSLTLLANLLKNGAAMFDKDTLENILE